ncbi:MAG: hypothetical protein Unbinned6224contig1001_25 [Prokaryotic dsDNA virus sp.]|nr:MAG: hypothetical protein Unbinned6224contig1001_25 [Prokaryotic dsDNA virus sp.]|tara:strand:- start:6865 stop:7752 length:888 start_codon:yes stop_codon:yes gene_type:complete
MSENEVLTSYSGVKISQDEANALMGIEPNPVNEGEQQAQEVESQETDQSKQPQVEQSKDLEVKDKLEFNGETYNMEQISEALKALDNKSEWQKTNTEKSQALSAERKAFEAEQSKWNSLRDNEEVMEALKDLLEDDHPFFTAKSDLAKETTSQDTEKQSKLEEIEDRLNKLIEEKESQAVQVEADRQVEKDIQSLQQKHPELSDSKLLDEVIQTAISKGFTGSDGLEDAFVLTYHKSAENSAFKSAVNRAISAKAQKSIPETEGHVKGQHTEPITKSKDYKSARADALNNYNFYE